MRKILQIVLLFTNIAYAGDHHAWWELGTVFEVDRNLTLTMNAGVTGWGNMVKTGEGSVYFPEGKYQATGSLAILGGSIRFDTLPSSINSDPLVIGCSAKSAAQLELSNANRDKLKIQVVFCDPSGRELISIIPEGVYTFPIVQNAHLECKLIVPDIEHLSFSLYFENDCALLQLTATKDVSTARTAEYRNVGTYHNLTQLSLREFF